jgi:hypothetical protein
VPAPEVAAKRKSHPEAALIFKPATEVAEPLFDGNLFRVVDSDGKKREHHPYRAQSTGSRLGA